MTTVDRIPNHVPSKNDVMASSSPETISIWRETGICSLYNRKSKVSSRNRLDELGDSTGIMHPELMEVGLTNRGGLFYCQVGI